MNVWIKVIYGVLYFAYCIYTSTIVQYEYWEKVCDVHDAPELYFYMMEDIQFAQCAVLCTQDTLCQSFEINLIENSRFRCGLMDFIVYHCQPSNSERVYNKVYMFVKGLIPSEHFYLQILCYFFKDISGDF